MTVPTAYIGKLTWGGHVYDDLTAGNQIEIWSCSMHLFIETTGLDPAGTLSQVATPLITFHTAAATKICKTCAIEWAKFSAIDPSTGNETTDPVPQVLFSGSNRGSDSSFQPTFIATRVSIDDSTRNRRARGGFYLPVSALPIGPNARWTPAGVSGLLGTVGSLFTAINSLTGVSIGVFSPTAHSFTPSNRYRIGDVPDVIRSRKNAMRETYTVASMPA